MDSFVLKKMAIFAARRALTIAGVYFAERGWVEGDVWTQAVPALALVAVDFAWSFYEKRIAKRNAESVEMMSNANVNLTTT